MTRVASVEATRSRSSSSLPDPISSLGETFLESLDHPPHHFGAGRISQAFEFVEVFFGVDFVVGAPHGGGNEDRSLERWLDFDHMGRRGTPAVATLKI